MPKFTSQRLLIVLTLSTLAFLTIFILRTFRIPTTPISPPPPAFRHGTITPDTLSPTNSSHAAKISRIHRLLILDYLHYHRRTFQSATLAHNTRNLIRPPVRTLIVRTESLNHGLGDRIRGILSAYITAVLSNRLLLIDWQLPLPLSDVLRGNLANFTYDSQIFSYRLPNGSFAPETWVVNESPFILPRAVQNVSNLLFGHVPRPNVAALIRAANREPPLRDCLKHYRGLSGLQDEDVFPLIMQALFTPSGALRDRMRLVMRGGGGIRALGGGEEEMEGGVGEGLVDVNKPYVAIHARLGYGVGEIRTAGRRFRLENYGVDMTAMGECFAQKAWEMARRNGVSDRFYLATDTIEFRDVLYAGLRRRMERAVLMFGEWDVKHVRDLKGGDEDDLDRYVNTFVEVLLLAGGLGIIHLRSGFADLAIWMGAFKGGGGGRIEYEDCRRFVAGGKQGMNDSMVVR